VVEDPEIGVVTGDPLYTPIQFTGERVALDDARLLAPVIPRSKVLGIGRNYAEHATELGNEVPAEPLVFVKPNTSVIGPGDPIVLPGAGSSGSTTRASSRSSSGASAGTSPGSGRTR
jgi:2-keto-4-pentenoate hydratase/2-oxohepta-3-ene-1,7-dioic acid hydratase in catechol pathway